MIELWRVTAAAGSIKGSHFSFELILTHHVFFDENANQMPENFLEAVSVVRGPNAWQPAPPSIEGSNAEAAMPEATTTSVAMDI